MINIDATLIRVGGHRLLMKRPKTKSGVRVLRVPLWLVAILRERRPVTRSRPARCFRMHSAVIGTRTTLSVTIRKVRRGTPFEWVVPHTCRTVATMLDRQGLSARTIADPLRHSRISMTQDVYMGRRPLTRPRRLRWSASLRLAAKATMSRRTDWLEWSEWRPVTAS